jgi:hypothetical protein
MERATILSLTILFYLFVRSWDKSHEFIHMPNQKPIREQCNGLLDFLCPKEVLHYFGHVAALGCPEMLHSLITTAHSHIFVLNIHESLARYLKKEEASTLFNKSINFGIKANIGI